jgi:hypothetical protein
MKNRLPTNGGLFISLIKKMIAGIININTLAANDLARGAGKPEGRIKNYEK